MLCEVSRSASSSLRVVAVAVEEPLVSEAAVAGALGLCLGGDNYYFGKLVHKPTIGDETRLAEPEDIRRSNHLLYLTAALSLLIFVGLRAGLIALF